MKAPDAPGVWPDIPIEAYHAGPGYSSSHLKRLHKESPFAYHFEYLTPHEPQDPTLWKNAPSRPMVIGGATAALMDGEEVFRRGYYVLPPELASQNKNSRVWKEGYAEAVTSNPTKTILLPTEYEQAQAIAEAPFNHPDPWTREQLRGLLLSPHLRAECSFYHLDEETGLLVKARPDLGIKAGFLADVKTTADCGPWAFSRKINDMGHHIQAALAIDIVNKVERTAVDKWLFVVVEQSPPYDVAVYWLGKASLMRGYQIYRAALTRLAGCLRNDVWPGKVSGPPIQEIEIPAYALNEDPPRAENLSVDEKTGVMR